MQRHRSEKRKPERKKGRFRQKDPLVEDGTTKGDVIFIGSLFITGLFLKTENAKSQKAEISVPEKEITHPTIKSTVSSPLFGAAMVIVAAGMYCKYRLFKNYDSSKNKSSLA